MVMPLPSHLRLPSPTGPAAHQHPRSPVKKHLRDLVASTAKPTKAAPARLAVATKPKLGSPQKLKATVASQSATPALSSTNTVAATAHVPVDGGRLRAATLQAVLGLVDRDDDALQQLLPTLHLLAALPLQNERVRRQCHAFLQQLQSESEVAGPDVRAALSKATRRVPTRDSGRAKSGVSLRHCKDFLLACANEIHELEEVNPCFDYAEDTGSEAMAVRGAVGQREPLACAFDYASLADSVSTGVRGEEDEDADDYDDACADTGSQLSELLYRTVEAEKADREAAAAVFHAWRAAVGPRARPAASRATLARAFAALKQHRAASALSQQLKKRAFGRLKALLVPASSSKMTATTMTTTTLVARAAPTPPSTTARVLTRMLVHWDLVLLLLVACFVQLTRLS